MSNHPEIVADRTEEVEVRGHKIIVSEVTMKNLKQFTEACAPFLSAFDEAGELAAKPDGDPEGFALFRVLTKHGDDFMRATALVTNADVAFYEKLKPDEFFKVAAKVVEVNGDFFVLRLAPMLIKFARGVSLIGSMLSGVSSQPGMELDSTS